MVSMTLSIGVTEIGNRITILFLWTGWIDSQQFIKYCGQLFYQQSRDFEILDSKLTEWNLESEKKMKRQKKIMNRVHQELKTYKILWTLFYWLFLKMFPWHCRSEWPRLEIESRYYFMNSVNRFTTIYKMIASIILSLITKLWRVRKKWNRV